jgi:hypothetical protein
MGEVGLTPIREAFVVAAESAVTLLDRPEVAAAWTKPSALPDFTVGGLAAHLAAQALLVPRMLAATPPEGEPLSLLEHYGRATWIGADLDADINVKIRSVGEESAASGPAAVVANVQSVVRELPGLLAAQPDDRLASPPAGPWPLRLDDLLITRMMEIAVHSDDLACSVGLPTPELPDAVLDPVFALLTDLARRRHGAVALLRALSRAERAPDTITAF